jgi:hypothetical protein
LKKSKISLFLCVSEAFFERVSDFTGKGKEEKTLP